MKVDAPQDVDLENNAKKLIIVKEVNECRVYDATLYAGGGIYLWCLRSPWLLAGPAWLSLQSLENACISILGGKGNINGVSILWTYCTQLFTPLRLI